MKIIFVSMDRKIFDEESSIRQRMLEYGTLFEHIDIIIFTKKEDNFEEQNIAKNVSLYPTQSRSRWQYINNAISIGKKLNNADYVSGDGPETSIVASRIARSHKAKLQIQIHTDIFNPKFIRSNFLNRVRARIVKRLLQKADSVRVVSKRIKDSIVENKKIKFKTDPIVLPIFQETPDIKDATSYLKPDEYSKFDHVFLAVSRLSPEKDIYYMLEIIKELIKLNNKIGLIIIGDGPFRDNLKLKIKNLDLENNVKLLGWVEKPWMYFRHADMFIQTSKYEGFGLSLFEAATASLSIISTDVGLIGDILHDGKSVTVISDNKIEAVNKIKDLLENPDISRQMGIEANSAVRKCYMNKQDYLDAYKNTFK